MTRKTKVEVLTAKAASDNDALGSEPHFPPGLLVSASNREEWELAIRAEVDWIDLKNPLRGPLGRPEFDVASQFAERMKKRSDRPWSIAGGELFAWSHDSDVEYCRLLGMQGYIKWALAGCKNAPDWEQKLKTCLGALPSTNQAILVHYADYRECDAPNWNSVLDVAREHRMRYVLIDTAFKDGRGLLDHFSLHALRECVEEARERGIGVAIAGSLRLDQLSLAADVGAQWVGVRGAVCSGPDRTSPFSAEKLERGVEIVRGGCSKGTRRESIHVLR